MTTLICDCNRTMPLAGDALGGALDEKPNIHTLLCRREAGEFQRAIRSGEPVLVACTQERRLFAELAAQTEGATSPLRFVNIRETGGWGAGGAKAGPKIAALLAAARLPEPEPVPTVGYQSAGRLLVIGPLDAAQRAALLLGDALDATIFALGGSGPQERRFPVLSGRIERLDGWLGAFTLEWSGANPIDLDACTRCNACLAACPEGAIGADYQIDLRRCRAHRDCVTACGAAAAIDFGRAPRIDSESFDLVLDLRAGPGAFARHAPPQGYLRWDGQDPAVLLQLRELVGAFEKPKFFDYRQRICAHSRNSQIGCNACVEICSAEAISSDKARRQVRVEPHLCVGCGACTTVCPSGAMSFAWPRAADQGARLKTLLATFASAGGRDAVLLLHSENRGRELVETLGRAAQMQKGVRGVPPNVIAVPLWHTLSVGLDLWLSAIAFGAARVAVLTSDEEAPQYLAGLDEQLELAQALLSGLGYGDGHFLHLRPGTVEQLDAALWSLSRPLGQSVPAAARFAVGADKRATLEFALDHLIEHAPARLPEAIPLPAAGAPFGAIEVDADACTLCLSCVGACPASAILDNKEAPELSFIESNCVQCGLCATTCPEDAIRLVPRLLLTPGRRQPRVLNRMAPYACVRCGQPFGTQKAIEAMLARLAGHSMFSGAALERLKMCADCRVIDIYSSPGEAKITEL